MDVTAVILALTKEVVVPEVTRIITEHAHANDGNLPTDDEVIAQLEADGALVKKIGQAYLDATRG